ncbi:response regulator transcription factor [Magnetococcus sp. PR-3]|uniref:response regulator transcription factor n=1 Tax=Magnetococcus sp. PR-3 TaxID=3120355 RepID=UPI002FCE027B
MKVLIADDHEIVRDGVELLLNGCGTYQVIAKVADGIQALSSTQQLKPDLIILDLSMPKMSGPDVITEIKKLESPPLILILTAYSSGPLLNESITTGFNGIVLKKDGRRALLDAIETIAAGKTFYSKSLPAHIRNMLTGGGSKEGGSLLSLRERQVLQLIAEGNTSKEVAKLLKISSKTVDIHRSHIKSKVGARNPMDLCSYAYSIGLVGNDVNV